MPSDERERQFERALQRLMREKSPDSACLDAETLAAYHERTLSLEELAKYKEHIGECLRCQEILALLEETGSLTVHDWEEQATRKFVSLRTAAMTLNVHGMRKDIPEVTEDLSAVQSAPPKEIPVRSSWKWMAPVGALAAGLLLFVAVRERKEQIAPQPVSVEMARNNETQAPSTNQQNIPQSPKTEELPLSKRDRQDSKQPAANLPKSSATPSVSNQASGKGSQSAAGAKVADKLLKDEASASKESRVRTDSSDVARLQAQNRTELDATRTNAEAQVIAPAPAPSAMGEVAVGRPAEPKKQSGIEANKAKSAAMTPTGEVAEVPEVSAKHTAQFSTTGRSLLKSAAKDSHMIVAPDGKHAWRVGAAGKIEATGDGARAWNPQVSGLSKDLTSGSAPSENVCWLVGKEGTILLTTDGGKNWIQIPSPVQDDLGGIHAVDAKHASIWSLRNRKSFVTEDAGVTWTPTANE